MKPDEVATTPAEPADDAVEPVPGAAVNEEQEHQDSSPSSPQPEKPQNEGMQEGAHAVLPPLDKEVNGKFLKPKDKTKAPVKTKLGTKATTTTGPTSRSTTAQSRVANGVMKTASIGASKKPASTATEMKSTSGGTSAQVKKVPTATTVAPRMQMKAAERKAVGSSRPVPPTSSGVRKTAAGTTSLTLGKMPVAGASNASFKPKTTAPRPTHAPTAKASVSAPSKAAPIPKTTRPTVATASRPMTSTAPVRLTTTAGKPTALKTVIATPSAADSASSQPSKVSASVAAKKDMKTTNNAASRKPMASTTTTRSTATKASKPEPPKPAAKRLPAGPKPSQPKLDEAKQVPTRKVPPSPRNISSRPAAGRMARDFNNQKQGANGSSVKHQTAKPTQSVLPLVVTEKLSKEQSSEPVEPSAVLETAASVTTAAIAPVESVMDTPSVELTQHDQQTSALVEGQEEGLQVPASEPTNVECVSIEQTIDDEPLTIQSEANVPVFVTSNPPTLVPEPENVHDNILVVAPMAQELNDQDAVTASPCEVPLTAQVPPKDLEVVEKQEQIICTLEEDEDEEREGSQQVSVSDMSGTQPTEESRPGSAGLTGSVWRAGGLPSEFDSEDVSCSQQGASELSAPGVLEGTESMDDLGEASLKGADGEGASAGSPDFEKFPDIPVNEEDDYYEDDDEDHVDDMEVGSEMTEDPHRQCNDNEDEDDDVEMASEGITESGLESYGNADEDDLAEDYRLDNLNRMQPSSIVPAALSAESQFADAWMQSLQSDSTCVSNPSSNPWQTYSESPKQPTAQACLDVESANTDLSSPESPGFIDPVPSSSELPLVHAAEIDMGFSQELTSYSQHISRSSTLVGPESAINTSRDASTPEEPNDYNISPGLENPKLPLPVLPDIMQDLGLCKSECPGSEHEEEEPETLPADDMFVGLSTVTTSAQSSHSSATGEEASDTEGDMQISDLIETGSTGNECFDSKQAVHSMSALVEECEEACVEMEGGGESDTPQSATSAASYGFECTTSNSNAQSTTESCIKSPGIFSLENEEQLSDEAKDLSLIKELNLPPADAPAVANVLEQEEEFQMNPEQQYMLCGKVTEELPEPCIVPSQTGLDSSSPSPTEHQQNLDLDAPHPYYSTICEKTDSFLTGSDLCAQQEEKVPRVHKKRPPKHQSGLRVDLVTRLPSDLPPRKPDVGCNAQLRRLELHQQQLDEIEQRREQQIRKAERPMKEENGEEKEVVKQVEEELEQNRKEKEKELEEQRRDLLHLQIQKQQQELKQRQQIMQWQQELEQQQHIKHQNSHQKNLTPVLLSPSGLCTIYEALETSDAEEDRMEDRELVLKVKVEHECSPKVHITIPDVGSSSDHPDSPQSLGTLPSPNPIKYNEGLTHSGALDSPPLSGSSSPQELDWNEKTDIVQQLISQTLLLNGDKCCPLLLLPGGAAGTLSPLETSLWPNLPPLTPPSATVTSVSSFSTEISGSSPQGEWTVVELETHH